MELQKIIGLIDAVSIPKYAKITQLKNKEDNEPYQVWRIDVDNIKYLKGFLNPVMIAHIVVTVFLAGTMVLMALGS